MPRTAEQLEEIKNESRGVILNSALELFAEHGYNGTSVRMIAMEAGVSQGLLYNYYEGKEALLRAIFERSMEDVQASFERAAGGSTPGDRIEGLVRAAFDIVRKNLSFWRLSYQLRMQPGVVEGLGESLRAWSEATRARIEALLRAAEVESPAVQARLLFAAIDGAAQHYALDPRDYPLDQVGDALIQHFRPLRRAPAQNTRGRSDVDPSR
jgi:AcrR family transcriptional regulator